MIASQQQLIRRNINNNNNISLNNSIVTNVQNRNNGNNKSNNVSNDEWIDSNITLRDETNNSSLLSPQQSSQSSSGVINAETNHSISSDLSNSDIKRSGDKSLVKKRRTNSSWLNLLSPSYKTRHEEFKRLFSNLVPNNERLVVDYSCALQKEILVHGRLYLSLNYIAFYANIFKWETSLVIKCRDITSLSKANTARVIPNAVQVITTSGDKYVFTSFAARDKTYVMLFRIWQNALLDQPMSSAELWQWVHFSYGEDLGLTSDDDEEYYSDNMPNSISTITSPVAGGQENSDSCNSSDPDFTAEPEVYEDCSDQTVISSKCKCASHDGKLILNVTFPVNIDRAFELIFTDNKFIHNLHKSRRTYDLCVTQWEDSLPPNEKVRQLNYTIALNHALVKSARTVETQRLLEDTIVGNVYTIKSEAVNEGVPYCDTFSVQSQWCLTQDSPNVTRLKVHAKVVYRKNIWGLSLMKPMIEKSSIQGITDFCNDLYNELPHWIEMERNLGVVHGIKDLKITVKDIDSVSDMSSIDETLIHNAIDGTERHTKSSTIDSNIQRNSIFNNVFNLQPNDAFLLKLILLILLLIFIINIMLFFRFWQMESKMKETNTISFSTQIPKNAIQLKEFIENSIKLIKSIETNLLQLSLC